MALNVPPGQPTPRWSPPGDQVPDNVWVYDIQRGSGGGWIPPDEPVNPDHTTLAMPIGWQPRGRDMPWQVVMSPPGTPAPMGMYNYTPKSREVHQPGSQAPVDETQLSLVPAGGSPSSPAGATAPVPAPSPPGVPPPGGSGMAAPPPPTPPGAPPSPRPSAPGMHPGGGAPPPTGMMPPGPSPTPLGTPPVLRPPQQQPPTGMGQGRGSEVKTAPPALIDPPGGGVSPPSSPQNLDPEMIARALLAQLVGVDTTPSSAVGQGQAVGVGAAGDDLTELQTQTLQRDARRYEGTPYVLGGNDPTKGIDCSGFVTSLLRGFGARVPGRPTTTTYRDQLAAPTNWDNIRPGDILLSAANPRDPTSGEHMALYVGGGLMAESTAARNERGGNGVRIRPVQGTNLQPYRMREPVPGLSDATLLAQHAAQNPDAAGGNVQLLSAQGAPQTTSPVAQQGQRDQRGLVQLAMDHGAPPELAQIMATGALMESGGRPDAEGDNKHSQGLYMMHDQGAGRGMSVEARRDPDNATQVMLQREYQPAYDRFRQQGLSGVELARAVYLAAERPAYGDPRHPEVTQHVDNDLPRHYRNITQLAADGKDVALGGAAVVPLQGPPGPQQQTAQQGTPNVGEQIWAAAQQVAQQVAGAVAPRTAYAAETASAPGPAPRPVATPGPMGAPQVDVMPQPAQAPAAAAATPSPQAAASPAVAPASAAAATLPQNQERAAARGYTPAAGPAYSAPPPPPPSGGPPGVALDPRANVPAAPAGFRWDEDRQAMIPATPGVYDLGHGPMMWNGAAWGPAPAASQRSTEMQGIEVAPGARVVTDPQTGTSQLYVTQGDGSILSHPIDQGAPPPAADSPGWTPIRGATGPSEEIRLRRDELARQVEADNRRYGEMTADQRAQAAARQRELDQAEARLAQDQANHDRAYTDIPASTAAQQQIERERDAQTAANQNRAWTDIPASMAAQQQIERDRAAQDAANQERPYNQMTMADRAQMNAPRAIGGGIFRTTTDDSGLPTGVEQIGDVPMTADAQANLDQRRYEFGNLSAEQQATLGEKQYEFGNLSAAQSANLGIEQQRLSQQHEEALLPYEKMTAAQQAQNQIDQQRLGLQQQQFGLETQKAQNQLEPLPRGGIARVNPFTGSMQMINAPEPEAEQYMGGYFFTPAGRTVNIGGQTVSGGPNPYSAWTPSQAGYGSWAPPQMQQQSAMQARGMQNWRPPQPQMQGWGAPQQQGWGGGAGGFGGY
jgi:cell wall-associated NlpC family hydrolase